ncbi:MAG: hypothetical protein ACREJC_19110, partial [Tepidisphaeraceae bacterium]
ASGGEAREHVICVACHAHLVDDVAIDSTARSLLALVRERALSKSEPESEPESEADQYDRATGDLGRPLYETKPCYGCGLKPFDHPTASGCQKWHDKP